jgi:PPP family 3-phenylpropionic acid transporter
MVSILALRGYNYFYFSLLAIFISFLPIYLADRGLSHAQIGLLIGTGSLIGILSQPFWGMISDSYKTIKKIILVTLGISVVVGFAVFELSHFSVLFTLVAAMYFFFLPTDPLTESLNYRLAEQYRVSFGSVRMYGAVGYASASLIVGIAIDGLGMESLSLLFVAYGLLTLLLILAVPDAPAVKKPVSLRDLGRFFAYPSTLRFFLLVLVAATPHRTNDSFLGVFVQSLGGSAGLVGQAWFYAAISEVAFFALSGWLLQKGNEIRWITLATGVYALRYLLCAMVTDPRWVVCLQLLQGVTFAVFYSASIQYLYRVIPEEWKATGQTALAVIFFGISGIIGSFAGGWVFGHFGGAALYAGMSLVSFVSFLFSLTLWKKEQKT